MAALIVQRRKIKQSEKRILLAEIGGIQFFSHSLNVSIMSQYYVMLRSDVSGSKKLCAQFSSDIFPRYGQWQLLKLA